MLAGALHHGNSVFRPRSSRCWRARLQQRAVDVPPALTITAQVVLALVFGGVGLLFATPLTAASMVAIQLLYVEDVLHEDAHVRGARPPAAAP